MAVPSFNSIGGVKMYAIMIVAGVIAAYFLASYEAKKKGFARDTITDVFLLALPIGLIGARIYFVLFHFDLYANDFLSVFKIWEGGLAIYGGVIAGAAAIYFYARHKKLSFFALCDILVSGVILAQAFGRWGNYFNIEAYGLTITDAAFQFFPLAVYVPSLAEWHMATFFYESAWNVLGFILLFFVIRKKGKTGDSMLWYFLWYGAGRMVIEGFRLDSLYLFSTGIRVSQLLSLLLVIAMLVILVYKRASIKKALSAVIFAALSLAVSSLCLFWQSSMVLSLGADSIRACLIPSSVLAGALLLTGFIIYFYPRSEAVK
ncbi:MAG: prolipoprotein diacylglyceryl transferase [Eubacteriales bacterium]|nr:prolipoprotein diacylglyceryl transferase [Eubacteriales bacterium]MDD4512465.1 prolipoprotein diacylglyceryl transferase [Eubacteriales bacterium]